MDLILEKSYQKELSKHAGDDQADLSKMKHKPSNIDLQDIVAKKHRLERIWLETVDPETGAVSSRPFENDQEEEFYFSGEIGTQTKNLAMKEALSCYQVDNPERFKPKKKCFGFGIQSLFVSQKENAFRILPNGSGTTFTHEPERNSRGGRVSNAFAWKVGTHTRMEVVDPESDRKDSLGHGISYVPSSDVHCGIEGIFRDLDEGLLDDHAS